jgi:Mitochondrial carrier protein
MYVDYTSLHGLSAGITANTTTDLKLFVVFFTTQNSRNGVIKRRLFARVLLLCQHRMVKTRMQLLANAASGQVAYRSYAHAVQSIYREGGLFGFYKVCVCVCFW